MVINLVLHNIFGSLERIPEIFGNSMIGCFHLLFSNLLLTFIVNLLAYCERDSACFFPQKLKAFNGLTEAGDSGSALTPSGMFRVLQSSRTN